MFGPGWTPVTSHSKDSPATLAASRARLLGVKIVKKGTRGGSRIHLKDIVTFFDVVASVDPTALILNHACELDSAIPVKTMAMGSMNYTAFLDNKTMPWGGPTEQQDQTLWMCYIASDILEPNLALLRNSEYYIKYQRVMDCSLQLTKLHESVSRVAFHVAYKDPLHTCYGSINPCDPYL